MSDNRFFSLNYIKGGVIALHLYIFIHNLFIRKEA